MTEETILIVDDDRTMVRLCQRLLERASYQVITALNASDGLRVLEQQRVDLLLSDIRMPVMDGFELISQVKHFQPNLPILVMTGYGSIENAIQALHRGVDGLILKPFENSAELVKVVRRILEDNRHKRDAMTVHALRPLFDVTERLLAETSPHALEKLIVETVTGFLQASFACIYRCEMREEIPGEAQAAGEVRVLECTAGECSAALEEIQRWLSSLQNAPVILSAGGPGSSSELRQVLQTSGLGTLMIAPVQRTNRYVFCAGRAPGASLYTEADLEMFVILARQAAAALENAGLYSELKDYVVRVEESQRALIQAEKMAAVGRLVASLAHEINNPLQAVRNCLHLAARKGLGEEQRAQYLEMTGNELDRLVRTVHDMLDFYRPVSIEKERVDISKIVEQVLSLLRPQMRDLGIKLHYNKPDQITPVVVVPSQMQQVIFNLMINAVDALEEMRSAGGPQPEKEIWVDIQADGRQVKVSIEDSGPGIPSSLGEQIFEPFISSKKNGTGLGLTVSFDILEKHQGSLALAPSQHASGARFEVVLPGKDE